MTGQLWNKKQKVIELLLDCYKTDGVGFGQPHFFVPSYLAGRLSRANVWVGSHIVIKHKAAASSALHDYMASNPNITFA